MSEYKRPHGKLICARKYPAQTGYRKDLYTNESASDPAERQALEVRFLQKVDDGAAQALDFLEQHACKPTDAFLRNAWSRFLMSLMHRSPQRVEYFNDTVAQQSADILIPYLREKYDEHRGSSDPTRFEDWLEKQNSFAPELRTRLLKGMIDSKLIGNTLNLMHWRTYILQHPRFGFLTGDSPLMMSNGVGHRRSFVVVAISPFRLFIAAHDPDHIKAFEDQRPNSLEHALNDACVQQSRHIIIAQNEAQTKFIDKRFLKGLASAGQSGLVTWNSPLSG